MNKEDPYRDQAEKLRTKIEKVDFEEGQMVEREDLPPRSRVHQKAKKNKWKLKYPVIRLLVLFFILLPITIFSIYSTIAKDKIGNVKETIGGSTEEFETIDIEDPATPPVTNGEESNQSEEVDHSSGNDTNGQMEGASPQLQQEGTVSAQTIAPPVNPQEKTVVYHKVKPGDTIYRISIKYYKSKSGIDTIKSANNLSSNEIRTGQVLTIPLNK
jgi:LysM repeat protein